MRLLYTGDLHPRKKLFKTLNNPVLDKMMAKLSEAEREEASAEIKLQFEQFQRADGRFEVTGEHLIAVGTK
jgi:CRISPR/Cas system-associated protein Csm6